MFQSYNTDKELEKQGVWYEPDPDFRVRLARSGGSNVRYKKIINTLTKP